MNISPIALFVYNRPWHTRQTVDALQKNHLANQSDLIIFSDGPKTPKNVPAVCEVREYIRKISGFRSISIVERAENYGLAKSIINGVTYACKEFGKVVVLEDDLVTSPYFLQYMNEAMDIYEFEQRVISIHGYTYPVCEKLPETFLLRGADCWGWGTWQRGWELFNTDAQELLESMKNNNLEYKFNFDGGYDFLGLLRSQAQGKNDSWAVRWYASAFLENKLTLYPGRSLVLNIGLDGSGVHRGGTKNYNGNITDRPIIINSLQIIENIQAREAVARFLSSQQISMPKRIIKQFVHSVNDLLGR